MLPSRHARFQEINQKASLLPNGSDQRRLLCTARQKHNFKHCPKNRHPRRLPLQRYAARYSHRSAAIVAIRHAYYHNFPYYYRLEASHMIMQPILPWYLLLIILVVAAIFTGWRRIFSKPISNRRAWLRRFCIVLLIITACFRPAVPGEVKEWDRLRRKRPAFPSRRPHQY